MATVRFERSLLFGMDFAKIGFFVIDSSWMNESMNE